MMRPKKFKRRLHLADTIRETPCGRQIGRGSKNPRTRVPENCITQDATFRKELCRACWRSRNK